ncbi:MAG TPA: glycogen debranching enzyme N-terminal domain-containing protein, partial [Candidatus Eisenbacteria bacterium]|nr:glycogen debranching enzyme N-terminal domain-containing protein [Candidatus Eisenbacteria bacterium]
MDGTRHRARAPKPAAKKSPKARKPKRSGGAPDAVVSAAAANEFAARALPALLAPHSSPSPADEWLETDGLGGFASGTVSGIRTRRYHALLLAATTPPTGRYVLVNGLEQRVVTPNGTYELSAQRYAPDVVHPDGHRRVESFTADPWPKWTYRLEDGTRIEQEILARHGMTGVVVVWRLQEPAGEGDVTLCVRPLLSGRDPHALHHENASFRFDASVRDEEVVWRPYGDLPGIRVESNGIYMHRPLWYRNFLYSEEQARGLDFTEDLASPGTFRFELRRGEAAMILTTHARSSEADRGLGRTPSGLPPFLGMASRSVVEAARAVRDEEATRRAAFPTRLDRAADAYLVRRGGGMTVVAGYPWFTDWGRDTFIAIRGLCIASGRLEDARRILVEWAGAVSEGMLPNLFVERGDAPEFNSVDASLWYVVAVRDFLDAASRERYRVPAAESRALREAVLAILRG